MDALDLLNQLKQEQEKNQAEYEKVCWFCKENPPAEKGKWSNLQLTKPAESHSYKVQSTYELHTQIPRCKRCYKIHTVKKIYNTICILMMLSPLVLTVTGIAYPPPQLMTIGIIGLVVGTIIYRIAISKHTKIDKYKKQYPPVLELKKQGYRRWWATMILRDFQQK